jgi:hypothetical protein
VQAGALVKMAHAFNCDTYADPEQWRAEDDLLLQVRHTPPRPAPPRLPMHRLPALAAPR